MFVLKDLIKKSVQTFGVASPFLYSGQGADQQVALNSIISKMFPAEFLGKITMIFRFHSYKAELTSPEFSGSFIC